MVTRKPSGAETFGFKRSAEPKALATLVGSGAMAELEDSAKSLILRTMLPLKLQAGETAFRAGDIATNYLVVKDGAIKVSVPTEQGRNIQLYRVEPGQTCVLTTASLLSGQAYEAEAVAETETEAIILPKPAFEELLASSPRFRQFVFASFGDRLHGLIGLVQEVILKNVDRRLVQLLLRLQNDGTVDATHETLAKDLNTAREVVTRLLNNFADEGWIKLARGQIQLLEMSALEDISRQL